MPIKVGKTIIPESYGPGWYDRLLELALLGGAGYFIWWAMNVFIEIQTEPYALIGLITAIVAGTESVIYLSRRKKEDTIKEVIRYEYQQDRTSFPTTVENEYKEEFDNLDNIDNIL